MSGLPRKKEQLYGGQKGRKIIQWGMAHQASQNAVNHAE